MRFEVTVYSIDCLLTLILGYGQHERFIDETQTVMNIHQGQTYILTTHFPHLHL
jgi:hypothetical protein